MAGRLVFRVHAVERMFQRGISRETVISVLETGETIEDYSDDYPYSSRLVLGWSGARPIHVVAAMNAETDEIIVITVYEPGLDEWDNGFRRRRP